MKPLIILTSLNFAVCCFIVIKSRLDNAANQQNPEVARAGRDIPTYDLDDEPGKLSLKELLDRPRAELARMANELEDQIRSQEEKRRKGELRFQTLPLSTRFSAVWPVWREAKYSSQRDMILPPYISESAYDSKLALHLVRFGDAEAARKLVEPGDKATLEEIDRLALPRRNYPAEWTRLVAMIFQQLHYSVAESDNHAARRVVALHRQLAALLSDNEVRQSPLASALLSRGQALLSEATLAWISQDDQEEWVDLASRALSEWGEFAVPVLPPARSADELAGWIGGRHSGLLVTSDNTLRALDMLGLPLPTEAADGVVGLFEPSGKLSEILVVYGQIHDVYEIKRLTYWLDEQIASSSPLRTPFRVEQHPGANSKEVIAPLAVVRLAPRNAVSARPAGLPSLPRDLSVLHLDRTFELNRRHIAWTQSGSRLRVADPASLGLTWPYAGQKFTQATLAREGKADLLADVQLTLAKADRVSSGKRLIDTAQPMWQTLGASRFHVSGITDKDTFNLIWSDGATEMSLCFPHNHEAAYIELHDDSGRKVEERLAAAQKRDAEERLVRWSEGKPMKRVQRRLDLFQLGMSRAELEVELRSRKTLLASTKVGELLTFPGLAQEGSLWIVRQTLVRFDESGKLIEARLRFTDAPGAKAGSVSQLIGHIRGEACAPELLTETDRQGPEGKSVKVMRWQDDATFLQARVDPQGIDVLIKDCPQEYAGGRPLPPAKWLPEGPVPECVLGAGKSEIIARWNLANPQPQKDGSFVLGAGDKSPYDYYLVYFSGDKVTRILARHRTEPLTQAEKADKALRLAWGHNAQAYGWPWQQTFNNQGLLKAWTTHDEVTQLKVFWQLNPSDGTLRLYTEWKQ